MRILPLALPAPKLAHDVPICAMAHQDEFVHDEPLEPNRLAVLVRAALYVTSFLA